MHDLRGQLIIAGVIRRIHITQLVVGDNVLDASEAHHLRDVLRLAEGTEVELFDDGGALGHGTLQFDSVRGALVRVERLASGVTSQPRVQCTVAAAIPKGPRADWMVEKLSELGVAGFIPLLAARSVVVPDGTHKLQRAGSGSRLKRPSSPTG